MQEKGRFPSQTLPNPRVVHELSFLNEPAPKMDEVHAIITLRSGKEIEQSGPKPASKTKEKEDMEPEHIIINEDLMKKNMPCQMSTHQVAIILGRPFLVTANAIINCRNGVMQLTFGNMTL